MTWRVVFSEMMSGDFGGCLTGEYMRAYKRKNQRICLRSICLLNKW